MMLSHKNWINHNLSDRLINPSVEFKYSVHPTKNKILSFHEAADFTAALIGDKYPSLYIGLSGGYDSEYIVRTFNRLKIPFKALMIKTSGNQQELKYAYHLCKELKIDPLIFECSDTLFLNILRRDIVGKLSSCGYNAVPALIGSGIAQKNNAIFISGDHLISDDIANTEAVFGDEWEHYYDVFYPGCGIGFYCYTVEIVRAMVSKLDNSSEEEWKYSLYNIGFRAKTRAIYNDNIQKQISNIIKERKFFLNTASVLGTNFEVLAMFDSWNKNAKS